ncbi:MAG: DNA replication and repair protein RecF [Chitinispirillaceae bacterium]|nr:DNA replication and repair protein RecF [Chitinispirillaceae bacterium]
MYLKFLRLDNFRNYEHLHISLPEKTAVFNGPNGSGKTSILEAVHLLCTGRSQKNAHRRDMVRHQSEIAHLEGEFVSVSNGEKKILRYSFNRENESEITVNQRKIPTFSQWYGSLPVVSIAPGDTELVNDNPDGRRRFMDMLISQIDNRYLLALILYRKNLVQRNRLLKTGGDPVLFSIYENAMAENGALLVEKRAEIIQQLGILSSSLYTELCGGKERFSLVYHNGFIPDNCGGKSWKNVFYTMLSERRIREREIGFSSFGPHRDDLFLTIDKMAARVFSSQGQCRAIALSLKLASVLVIEKNSGKKPIVLFDDAVSELDPVRTSRVYDYLHDRGQTLIASPHNDDGLHKGALWYRVAGNTAVAYDRS